MSSLDGQIDDFLSHLASERRASPHTLAAYGSDLRGLAAFLRDADLSLESVGDMNALRPTRAG